MAACTALMDGASDELFASPGLPLDEDGRVGGRDELDLPQHRGESSACANDLFKNMLRMAPGFAVALFLSQPFAGVSVRAIVECDAVHGRHSSTMFTDEANRITCSAASFG